MIKKNLKNGMMDGLISGSLTEENVKSAGFSNKNYRRLF